jgi:ABC-type bacteriocin/lantibiotic exporter with double-glycine peptidase domain
MYSDPRILILDEATSALDTVTSEQIVNEVCSLCGTKTIIVISHDPFVLSNCDNVLHLSNATVTLTRGAGTGASQESSF